MGIVRDDRDQADPDPDEAHLRESLLPNFAAEMSPVERFLLGMVAFILLLLLVQFSWLASLSSRMADTTTILTEAEQTSAENRAVSCRVLLTLGQSLAPDGPCFDPNVVGHYAPEGTQAVPTVNTDAICDIARHLEVTPLPQVCTEG